MKRIVFLNGVMTLDQNTEIELIQPQSLLGVLMRCYPEGFFFIIEAAIPSNLEDPYRMT